jgi:hypothetical protein
MFGEEERAQRCTRSDTGFASGTDEGVRPYTIYIYSARVLDRLECYAADARLLQGVVDRFAYFVVV